MGRLREAFLGACVLVVMSIIIMLAIDIPMGHAATRHSETEKADVTLFRKYAAISQAYRQPASHKLRVIDMRRVSPQ